MFGRALKSWRAVQALIPCLLLLACSSFGPAPDPGFEQPFDATVWQAAGPESGPSNPRSAMLADVVKTVTVVGETRAKVRDQLGPPDSQYGVRTDAYVVGANVNGIIYMDPHSLVIDYDKNDRVRSANLIQH